MTKKKVFKKTQPKKTIRKIPKEPKTLIPMGNDIMRIKVLKTRNVLLMTEQTREEILEDLMEEFGISRGQAYGIYRQAQNIAKKDMQDELNAVHKGIRNELFACLDKARTFGNLKESVSIIKLLMQLYGLEQKQVSIEVKENKLKDVETEKLIEVLDEN